MNKTAKVLKRNMILKVKTDETGYRLFLVPFTQNLHRMNSTQDVSILVCRYKFSSI